MLPALDVDGRLPPGRHGASLDDVYEVFVVQAPYRDDREVIFSALRLYLELLKKIIPTGTLWLDGGFVAHKTWAPKDVDLALVVPSAALNTLSPAARVRLLQLLTLQGVHVSAPASSARRVQPMGGLVDAFVVPADDAGALTFWDTTWSAVTDLDGRVVAGATKGYVEVPW